MPSRRPTPVLARRPVPSAFRATAVALVVGAALGVLSSGAARGLPTAEPAAAAGADIAGVNSPPEPAVVTISMDAGSGVLTAAIDNGVVVRHRAMHTAPAQIGDGPSPGQTVVLRIALWPQADLSPAQRRALVLAADAAWSEAGSSNGPALDHAPNPGLSARLQQHGLRLRVLADPDSVALELSGPAAALDAAADIAHALLSPESLGVLHDRAWLDAWRARATESLAHKRWADPVRAAEIEAWAAGRAPDDPWLVGLTPEAISAADPAELHGALLHALTHSAVAAAVVGPVEAPAGVGAIARATRSLRAAPGAAAAPPSSPHGATTTRRIERHLTLPRPAQAEQPAGAMDQAEPASGVVVGVRFRVEPGLSGVSFARRLIVAATVLEVRLNAGAAQPGSAPLTVKIDPGPASGGLGMLWVAAPILASTTPDQARERISAIERVFETLAESGPTPDEIAHSAPDLARLIDLGLASPGSWASRLTDLDRRGMTPADIVGMKRAYLAIGPTQAAEAFRRAWWDGTIIVVTASPGDAPSGK